VAAAVSCSGCCRCRRDRPGPARQVGSTSGMTTGPAAARAVTVGSDEGWAAPARWRRCSSGGVQGGVTGLVGMVEMVALFRQPFRPSRLKVMVGRWLVGPPALCRAGQSTNQSSPQTCQPFIRLLNRSTIQPGQPRALATAASGAFDPVRRRTTRRPSSRSCSDRRELRSDGPMHHMLPSGNIEGVLPSRGAILTTRCGRTQGLEGGFSLSRSLKHCPGRPPCRRRAIRCRQSVAAHGLPPRRRWTEQR
jgi:hypothetical protein